MSKNNPPKAWTIAEAVAHHPLLLQMEISERQLRRAVQEGRISYLRPGGNIIRLLDSDIEAFVYGSRVEATK